MILTSLFIAIAYFSLCHFIAQYIGASRAIGYSKTMRWSIVLSPVIGLLMAISSPKPTLQPIRIKK